ncbi:MAG: hypothetical protein AAB401_24045, partial [Acidobacteriota bacterium]
CVTFKKNATRVDNACKDILSSKVIPALQADAGARIVVDGYRGEKEKPASISLDRAKNVRDRLADGKLGTAIDANRIVVRDGGASADTQVKIWLVPSGGVMPEGPAPATVGDVTPEKGGRRPAKKAAVKQQ